MRLIDADALKEDIDNLRLFKKWIREEIKTHIDNAPTVETFKPMCKAKDEAICEEMTTDGHCNYSKPCPNKEERPQTVDCTNCKYESKRLIDEPCKYCNIKYSEWEAKDETN